MDELDCKGRLSDTCFPLFRPIVVSYLWGRQTHLLRQRPRACTPSRIVPGRESVPEALVRGRFSHTLAAIAQANRKEIRRRKWGKVFENLDRYSVGKQRKGGKKEEERGTGENVGFRLPTKLYSRRAIYLRCLACTSKAKQILMAVFMPFNDVCLPAPIVRSLRQAHIRSQRENAGSLHFKLCV